MNTQLNWHSLSNAEALKHAATTMHGLPQKEAGNRLTLHGNNSFTPGRRYSPLRRFLLQFNNTLIYILLGSAIVTGIMQHWTDTGVILCVVLINALIGFVQEHKAENALAAIRQLLSPHANVLRDGKPQMIDAALLVPGDIVLLTAGDKVPADIRLLTAHDLRIQESILTGESLDVEKSIQPVSVEAGLSERSCMAFSGTLITAGQGKGVVVATGIQTEIGRISQMLEQVEQTQTPLAIKLSRFSRWLAAIILCVAFATFLFGVYIYDLPVNEMFMVMIGIAVSSIPEGLPAVISITLALGVRTMARKNAIVRHLPVIEALGSATVICTDKTGTLTRNELAVSHVITAEHQFTVTGVGYMPEGKFLLDEKEIKITEYAAGHAMLHGATLNNDAVLSLQEGVWELNGDPTEGALMALALKAGHTREQLQNDYPRKDIVPFSAETRFMATLHQSEKGNIIYVKGAPEQLLSMCDRQLNSDDKTQPLNTHYWELQVSALAGRGERVLAIALKYTDAEQTKLNAQDVQSGLVLLGLFGITDRPREEAKPAIAECYRAGIAVKMITGDHKLTAAAIGKELGIKNSDKVLTGSELDRLSDQALSKVVEEINIYARMHPEHKLRLVKALKANGEIVAMTGDGVNDAPALKIADIGIAMGIQGTEVAKEASALVLADDNFASIVEAVAEGRNIYRNIRRTLQFMLVTDGAEGMTLLIALLAGFTLPITPLQILWVNMITAVTLSLAFAFTPHDPTVMRYPPLAPNAPFFPKSLLLAMFAHLGLLAFGTLGLFLYEIHETNDVAIARTIAVNALVGFQVYYLWGIFPARPQNRQWHRHYMPAIIASISIVPFQLCFTYTPWMQSIFATAPLSPMDWLKVSMVTSVIYVWLWIARLKTK
jgi:calcium-translocating P-type ATPase